MVHVQVEWSNGSRTWVKAEKLPTNVTDAEQGEELFSLENVEEFGQRAMVLSMRKEGVIIGSCRAVGRYKPCVGLFGVY